jgi:hypothetical protein
MNVYLVPVGAGRHALYCEVPETEIEPSGPVEGQSWRARMMHRFRRTVADAEAQREREELGEAPKEKGGLGRYIVGRIAEAVAEQRLLWHLRRATQSTLVHPHDMDGREALGLARAEFAADYRKHLRHSLLNGAISAVLGVVFFFVPGPNLVAYYFLFLAIGHYFALRGAGRGYSGIDWSTDAAPALTDVRLALALEAPERRERLERITESLGLVKLWRFIERVARRGR